jgi:hypothetical protein
MRPYFKSGSWNANCDICGFRFKAEQLRKDWRGLMVCEKDYEMRNPQDFLRISPEHVVPPWTRPEGTDTFIPVTYVCSFEGSSSVAGIAIAGCSITGSTTPPFIPGISAVAGRAIASRAVCGSS